MLSAFLRYNDMFFWQTVHGIPTRLCVQSKAEKTSIKCTFRITATYLLQSRATVLARAVKKKFVYLRSSST